MTKEKNTIDDLLETHGKRIQPDDLMKRRAMKNVKAHWQANLERQQTQKSIFHNHLLRVAATVLLFVGAGVFLKYSEFNNTTGIFTTEQFVQGEILYSTDGNSWYKSKQKYIEQGVWLKTSKDSFTNITLFDNSQLRINQNTIVEFVNLKEVRIVSGEIYHDADNASKTNPLKVNTSLGSIQHIGTRYLVNKTESDLKISVRNGLVKVSKDDMTKQIASGKQLSMDSNGIQNEKDITAYDILWNWTQNAGIPFQVKDKSLNDFIVWFAHENGYKIDWNTLQNKTKRVQLTGNISNLTQSQQIKAIFLSTKFDYQINQGILRIL
jgi:hypothetical protein